MNTKTNTNTIKFLRESLGLTQHELSKELNIPQPTICGYENGNARPSIKRCSDIIKFAGSNGLQVTLEQLLF